MKSADYWIDKLELVRHPEGGFYRETYRSEEKIPSGLPGRYEGERSFSTSIYFLLKSGQYSAFHRIQSDEIWHFYSGSSATVYMISPDGTLSKRVVGSEAENGEVFQLCIPRGTWFGAEVNAPDSYSLVGCTVAPGFDFRDFEMGNRADLVKHFPWIRDLIMRLSTES